MEAERLTDWLWSLRTPIVQAYAVRERDGFVLIDTSTAGNEGAILDALGGAGATVHEIALTHGHDDHTGSAAKLVERTGARVLAPTGDIPFIQREAAMPPPQLLDWEVPIYEQVAPNVPAAPPVHVDVSLEDGAVLGWAHEATVMAAPGHTPGSIALLFERDKLLVAGDAIASHEGEPMLGVFNVDPARAADSFRRLAELDVEFACFGHGDPVRTDARARLNAVAARL